MLVPYCEPLDRTHGVRIGRRHIGNETGLRNTSYTHCIVCRRTYCNSGLNIITCVWERCWERICSPILRDTRSPLENVITHPKIAGATSGSSCNPGTSAASSTGWACKSARSCRSSRTCICRSAWWPSKPCWSGITCRAGIGRRSTWPSKTSRTGIPLITLITLHALWPSRTLARRTSRSRRRGTGGTCHLVAGRTN